MTAPALFPAADALGAAALHLDLLRRLADPNLPPAETLVALGEELGHTDRGNFNRSLKRLEADGLITRSADTPTGVAITAAGRQAITGVEVATGDLELDLTALYLTHDRIRPNPNNPRGDIDEDAEDFVELMHTVVARGVLLPLLVYPADRERLHMLDAGERRWRAIGKAIRLGLLGADFRIPCRLKEPSEDEAAVQAASTALIENGARKNLTMLQRARAFRTVVQGNPGRPVAELARRHGLDPRTGQEMLKVLAEANPDHIKACEAGDPDWKWEALRDSVKSLKLSPQQALILIEVASRMETEEPAADDDRGGPPWIEIAHTPIAGPQVELCARKILELTTVEHVPLCRLRTDNSRVEGWLETVFGVPADERRALTPEARSAALYKTRAEALGAFQARELEKAGKWATPWLNVAPPQEEVHRPHGPHEQGSNPEAREGDIPRREAPQSDPAPDPDAYAPVQYGDVGVVSEVSGQSGADEPRRPTARERMILAEIAHKTMFDPVRIPAGESGFAEGALLASRAIDDDLRAACWEGWAGMHLGVGPAGEQAVRLLNGHVLAARGVDPENVDRLVDEARAAAGLSLAERHALTQTRRYAFEPLNAAEDSPPQLTPDLPELKADAALALVELAATIAREGQQLPGRSWRTVEAFDYHRDAGALALLHTETRYAGFLDHKGAYHAYLTDRGRDWLRAHDVDPDAVGEADLARFREAAEVGRAAIGWSSPFLNPKAARETGPAREAAEPPRAPLAPLNALFVQFGETGENIRLWKRAPFLGATRYVNADELLGSIASVTVPLFTRLSVMTDVLAEAFPDQIDQLIGEVDAFRAWAQRVKALASQNDEGAAS